MRAVTMCRPAGFLILLLLYGCGGSGGGAGAAGGSSPGTPIADLTGTWQVTERGVSDCPDQATYTAGPADVTISQTGNSLSIAAPAGTFTGGIEGDTAHWKGSFPSGSGTTSIRAMALTVAADGRVFSGSASLAWTDGRSSCSGVAQAINAVRVPGSGPVPSAPTGAAVTALSSSSLGLSWSDTAADESGFRIERRPGGAASFAPIAWVGANATSYTDAGLNADTAYDYRVRAYNANGDSAPSNTGSASTLAVPAGAPSAPSLLITTATSTSEVTLSWTDNAANETDFRIERSTQVHSGYREIAAVAGNTTAFTDSGLTGATQYFYRIRASNAAGASAYSNVASPTTQPSAGAPLAPTDLAAASMSARRIDLRWSDDATSETGFKIERSLSPNVGFTQIGMSVAGAASFVDRVGLEPATKYYYRVRATNAPNAGDSGYSNTAEATTRPLVRLADVIGSMQAGLNGLRGNEFAAPPSISGVADGVVYTAGALGYAFCRPADVHQAPLPAPPDGQTLYGCANTLSAQPLQTSPTQVTVRFTGGLFVDVAGTARLTVLGTAFDSYLYGPAMNADVTFSVAATSNDLHRLAQVIDVKVDTGALEIGFASANVLTARIEESVRRDMGAAAAAAIAEIVRQKAAAVAASAPDFSFE